MNNERKNSAAKIRANAKYSKAHYKNISIKVKPEEAEEIRETAGKMGLSIAKLILLSVREYGERHAEKIGTADPQRVSTCTRRG